MGKNTLSKHERLKSTKLIDQIFSERKSVKAYPFVAAYKLIDKCDVPVLFGASASKRHFKRAVDRNRIKRLTRETFRTQKELIEELSEQEYSVAVMFIFIGKEMPNYDEVKKGMKKALIRLTKTILSNA